MPDLDRLAVSLDASIIKYDEAMRRAAGVANLTRFLTGYAARPFAWGECGLILAAWWQENHPGETPARELVPLAGNAAALKRIVAERGGLAELVTAIAAGVSAEATDEPVRGDFGLVEKGGARSGAIYCGGRFWAIRNEAGIGFLTDPQVIAAWRI